MTMRGPHPHVAVVRLLDEVGQHLLGDLEVGDHAVLHRLDGHDVARRAAEHLLGLLADGLDAAVHLVDGDDRGFVDDDALAARVDARVGGAEVDGQVAGKEREQRANVHGGCAPIAGRHWPDWPAAWIPSLPRSLIQYMASSAARTSASAVEALSGSDARPMDTVRRTARPSVCEKHVAGHALADALGDEPAPRPRPSPGSTTANSSPAVARDHVRLPRRLAETPAPPPPAPGCRPGARGRR